MRGYLENGDASQSMRNCRESRRLDSAYYRVDANAALDDVREAVTTLEDAERIARRVFGGAHPMTVDIGRTLQNARAALARASVAK